MTVGICTFEIIIDHAQSLKEKRKVVHSLVSRVRSRHNVSVAEVAHQDLWQRAGIAIAAVSSARKPLSTMFDGILRDLESVIPAQIVNSSIEYI